MGERDGARYGKQPDKWLASFLVKGKSRTGEGEGSVEKAPDTQAGGPEFRSQKPTFKSGKCDSFL